MRVRFVNRIELRLRKNLFPLRELGFREKSGIKYNNPVRSFQLKKIKMQTTILKNGIG